MSTLRVGSYNLLHGMRVLGGAVEADQAALQTSVASLDVDVLGMQEVDAAQPRSGAADQTALAARALGADHWRFLPTVVGTPGPGADFRPSSDRDVADAATGTFGEPQYGVGLVSRHPVAQWRWTIMPAARATMPLLVPGNPRPRLLRVPDEPRAVLAAVLDLPRPVTIATVHLSFVPVFNIRQLRRVRAWLADLPRPLVLLGDFNLPGRIPSRVTGWQDAVRAPTYPVFRPRVQFDHILADGLTPVRGQVHALPVSDHCAVSATFERD